MPDTTVLTDARTDRLDVPVCRMDSGLELRAGDGDDDDDEPRLAGHFSTFNDWYEIDSFFEGRFLERIAPGAFRKTFAEQSDRIRVLLEHGFDPTVGDKPLGVPEELSEDDEGARYLVRLFDSPYVRDLIPAFESGQYGASFRMKVLVDEWDHEPESSEHNPDAIPERTIREVRVFEFGPTVFPANPETTAGMRSLTDEFYARMRDDRPDDYRAAVDKIIQTRTGAGERQPQTALPSDVPAAPAEESSTPRFLSKTKQAKEAAMEDERMSFEERRARQSEIRSRLAEIDQEFVGGELSDEARAEWDELNTEHEVHERAIRDEETRKADLKRLTESDSPRVGIEKTPDPSEKRRVPSHHVDRGADIYDLSAIRRQAGSIDDLPQLYRDNAKRAVEGASFPGRNVSREQAQTQVEQLLDTVDDKEGTLARRILATGSPVYQRAFGKVVETLSTTSLTAEEQRALAVGTDGAGGYAVPFQLDPTIILTSDGSINPLRDISRVEQVTGKEWQGVTSEGITVTRSGEGAQASDDAPTLDQPTVRPTRVQGFVPFSVEVDQDWSALRSEMTRLLADAKDQEEAGSFVNGNGNGNNPAGVVETLAAGSLVPTGSVGGFATADVYKVKNALPPRFRGRGRFVAETSIYDEIRQFDEPYLVDNLRDPLAERLIGYPAHEISTMPSTVEEGNKILLFGDFRQFLIVDRVGMNIELVPHLFGGDGRPTGQRGLYAIWRNSSLILTDNAFRLLQVQAA